MDSARAPKLLGHLTHLNRRVRDEFVQVLLGAVALGVLLPELGLWLKDAPLGVMPFTGWRYDVPNLALGVMMLSASVQCELRDFRHLVERPRAGVFALLVVYLVVPLAASALGLFGASELPPELGEQLQVGLMMSALMPVATTSSVWVRQNGGALALLLALIMVTTALSVLSVPLYLTALVGISGADVQVPAATLVEQLVMSVSLPCAVGLALRALWPRGCARWTPLFSLLGSLALIAAILVNMAVASPHLWQQGRAVALMVALAAALAGVSFGVGLLAARWAGLAREDAVTLLFASGMRSNSTGLVLALKSFPALPLVCVPAAAYLIVQHVLGALVTRSLQRAKSKLLGKSIALEPRSLSAYLDRVLPHAEGEGFTLLVFRLEGAPRPALSRGLKALVRRLRQRVRVNDFICLLPPDRFGLVLVDAKERGRELVLGRVQSELRTVAPGLTLCSGLAHAPTGIDFFSADQLIELASGGVEDTVVSERG